MPNAPKYHERIENGVVMRQCYDCCEWKTLDKFYRRKSGRFEGKCRVCNRKRTKRYEHVGYIPDPPGARFGNDGERIVAAALRQVKIKFLHWEMVKPGGFAPSAPGW